MPVLPDYANSEFLPDSTANADRRVFNKLKSTMRQLDEKVKPLQTTAKNKIKLQKSFGDLIIWIDKTGNLFQQLEKFTLDFAKKEVQSGNIPRPQDEQWFRQNAPVAIGRGRLFGGSGEDEDEYVNYPSLSNEPQPSPQRKALNDEITQRNPKNKTAFIAELDREIAALKKEYPMFARYTLSTNNTTSLIKNSSKTKAEEDALAKLDNLIRQKNIANATPASRFSTGSTASRPSIDSTASRPSIGSPATPPPPQPIPPLDVGKIPKSEDEPLDAVDYSDIYATPSKPETSRSSPSDFNEEFTEENPLSPMPQQTGDESDSDEEQPPSQAQPAQPDITQQYNIEPDSKLFYDPERYIIQTISYITSSVRRADILLETEIKPNVNNLSQIEFQELQQIPLILNKYRSNLHSRQVSAQSHKVSFNQYTFISDVCENGSSALRYMETVLNQFIKDCTFVIATYQYGVVGQSTGTVTLRDAYLQNDLSEEGEDAGDVFTNSSMAGGSRQHHQRGQSSIRTIYSDYVRNCPTKYLL